MKKRYLLTTSILIDIEVENPGQGPEDNQTFEDASRAFREGVARATEPFPTVSYHGGCEIAEVSPTSNLHRCARCAVEFSDHDQEVALPGLPPGRLTEHGPLCEQCECRRNTSFS